MHATRHILRNVINSNKPFLYPVVYSKVVFNEKASKLGSTSDGSSSSDEEKPKSSPTNIKSSSDSSSSSSDDELLKKPSRNEALDKLNSLLKRIVEEDLPKTQSNLKLAQPVNKRVKKVPDQTVKTEPVEKKIVDVAKDVAQSLGGNIKQTESELLAKLLTPVESHSESASSLSEILKGMKIDREPKTKTSRAGEVKKILEQASAKSVTSQLSNDLKVRLKRGPTRTQTAPIIPEKINLLEGDTLGIFTDPSNLKDSPQLPTLKELEDRDLRLAVTHPPSNYYQEMILWTEQGKLWKFPIDNAYGLEEESKVYFADHVFLEKHLEPWCPTKGPIRHFMELVCVGLSKNHYLTVKAKREHIEWYRDYFESKKKLLQEIGAIPAKSDNEKVESIEK